jgi:hypothetical protein
VDIELERISKEATAMRAVAVSSLYRQAEQNAFFISFSYYNATCFGRARLPLSG